MAGEDARGWVAFAALFVLLPLMSAMEAPVTVFAADNGDAQPSPPPAAPGESAEPEQWSAHFQFTGVAQGYPGFRSPFEGANSLPSGGEVRETLSATAFLGGRLPWYGGELYIDPEFNQGFGLDNTLGIAGFPNGEAQKAGFNTPKLNVARLFLRQTFGLGGDKETLEPDANQLGETVDVSRVTVTFGKIAAPDIFDDNQYAHDPRTTFFNWSIWEGAAWDFPADQKGYTDGLAVELNEARWALRGGWFLEPKVANERDLDPRFWKHYGAVVELETRHDLWGEPGKLHYLVFLNRANMGSLEEATDIALATGTPADIAAVRTDRWKVGFVLNLEQAITADLGFFARASWNDGRTEDWAFTDVDRSVSAGLSLKGTSWGRATDTVGLAAVVDMLSKAHRNFFAAGGLGILVGDGQLDYAPETILEAYYNWQVTGPVLIGPDYQFVVNPGYEAARGPVSIFAVRLHIEF